MDAQQQELYEFLSGFLSEERKEKFERHIRQRTRYITIAVEDIYQPHNASAVLRSAECFGVQDVHVIENRNSYNPNSEIALGAHKWLNIHKHSGTGDCIKTLRANGYRIVATTPHTNDCLVSELDLSKGKAALFFGTELEGISKQVLEEADEFVKIPMFGFTESFNISVSAAICLYELLPKLRKTTLPWQLTATEMQEILLQWAKSSINRSDLLVEEFQKKKEPEA